MLGPIMLKWSIRLVPSSLLSSLHITTYLQPLLRILLRHRSLLLSSIQEQLTACSLSDEGSDKAKRIHLRVASESQVGALLFFNNIIYARSVEGHA